MVEGQQFPTYMIVPLNDVQLRSGRVLDKPSIDTQKQSISEEDFLKPIKVLKHLFKTQALKKKKKKSQPPQLL